MYFIEYCKRPLHNSFMLCKWIYENWGERYEDIIDQHTYITVANTINATNAWQTTRRLVNCNAVKYTTAFIFYGIWCRKYCMAHHTTWCGAQIYTKQILFYSYINLWFIIHLVFFIIIDLQLWSWHSGKPKGQYRILK